MVSEWVTVPSRSPDTEVTEKRQTRSYGRELGPVFTVAEFCALYGQHFCVMIFAT